MAIKKQDKQKEPGIVGRTVGRFVDFFNPTKSFITKQELYDFEDEDSEIKVVPHFKSRNDFPKALVKLLEVSPTHRRCVYSKADICTGNGFGISKGQGNNIITTKTHEEEEVVQDQVIEDVQEWAKEVNTKKDSLLDIAYKSIIEYEGQGNVFVEHIRGEVNGKKFYNAVVHTCKNCLFEEPKKVGAKPEYVYISPDWDFDFTNENKPAKLPVNKWEKIRGSERMITVLRGYAPGRDIYGLAPFIAAFLHAQIELEVPSNNLEKFYTDFMPKIFAQFFAPDGMTEEEKQQFYEDFEETYTRKGRQRRSIFTQIVESEAMKANIELLSQKLEDGEFLGLSDKTEATIFKAHAWHPLLAGVPSPSGLSNSSLVQNVFLVYKHLTVEPLQRIILEKIINKIFVNAGEWLGSSWREHYLTLNMSIPPTFVGDISINKILTKDEGRKLIGMDKLQDEKQGSEIIDSGKPTQVDLLNPGKDNPAKTDPAKTDPAKTDPAKTDPNKSEEGANE